MKSIEVIAGNADQLILNTIADEKQAHLPEDMQVSEHEAALLALYARLRPGNPPQVEKARSLFEEKFYDENRYRLGKVGRFRINRKFEEVDIPEDVMRLTSQDFLAVINYLLDLRSNRNKAHIDDIDHLGNRRLRTLDELAVEEMRKGLPEAPPHRAGADGVEGPRRADQGRRPHQLQEHQLGGGPLLRPRRAVSQVVDQTNPLSQLTHERRLSALGPGGLNRKRAGFEVRDVHISHYGRICPIETPEGTNIGLIASAWGSSPRSTTTASCSPRTSGSRTASWSRARRRARRVPPGRRGDAPHARPGGLGRRDRQARRAATCWPGSRATSPRSARTRSTTSTSPPSRSSACPRR